MKATPKRYFSRLILIIIILLMFPVNAFAATITVTNNNDSGAGSLRQAISDAAAGDTITFDGDYTITLASPLTIAKDLTIDGAGHVVAISGNDSYRVFIINSGTVMINNLTIRNGLADGTFGGGILNHGNLTISNSTLIENEADSLGGAIYTDGTLSILNSDFTKNTADNGGAIENFGGTIGTITSSTFSENTTGSEDGGAISNSEGGTISTITDSTFSNNTSAYDGGAISNWDSVITLISKTVFDNNLAENDGGAIGSYGDDSVITTIIDSTFTGNTAIDDGGAIENERGTIDLISNTTFSNNKVTGAGDWAEANPEGGAIENFRGTINTISNSTFFGNSAENVADDAEKFPAAGGAIWNGSYIDYHEYDYPGIINSIVNTTFFGNSANGVGAEGGGINNAGRSGEGPGIINNISNTIIAGNSPGGNCIAVPNGTNNITDSSGCDSWANTGFVLSTLGPLADNGGTTETQALLVGSLAIDGGDPTICANSPVNGLDQRGLPRLFESLCDIGAYEYQEVIASPEPIEPAELPDTGFPRGVITQLPAQPDELKYENASIVLKIPSLDLEIDIVGVPFVDGEWDTSWLGYSAGWLNGTAYPTWQGNTVITGHVWSSWNQPGIFRHLDQLQAGHQFNIIAYGQIYTYQVQDSVLVRPGNLSVLGHSEYDMITLLTCEGYSFWTGDYRYRRAVKAILINVSDE